ncbi:hypothetical protein [Syntrophotalea acetylenica]|jgi:hypothetical protein|uniref:hypothetical protein n=1 Tax=Syntrophotalea TaxID=2812025 RepID=UPI002A361C22|nr:hypothetical protein [Syntrophotalea acetylenica]MDY0262427.1 hypothetical protein [Syntrophotalea acetylenica]
MREKRHPAGAAALRLTPLNRLASLKLKAAGVSEHPVVLPVFQLMSWGLADCACLVHEETADELVQLVWQPDQRAALDYLLANVPGGATAFQRRLLRMPPRAAARALLGAFDLRLRSDPRNPFP